MTVSIGLFIVAIPIAVVIGVLIGQLIYQDVSRQDDK